MNGAIILAGGGGTPDEVPQTILRLAGGANARVVILAHTQEDVGRGARRSAEFFAENGAQNVLAPDTKDPEELAGLLREARAVWIPGGDQNRFMERLGGSEAFLKAMREVVARGGVAGGTSAGASLMGARMPTGDHSPNGDLKTGASPLAPALGLLPNAIVDQHFLKRQRLPRLLCAVLENPQLIGVGVDEDAWAIVQGKRLTVNRAQVLLVRARAKTQQRDGLLGNRHVQIQLLLPKEQVEL
ncbi:MAG: cyanophycinase [Fimbriimonadales bacterium]|nr:cyanophycinase [Fimbriimonadales bacterium]